MRGIQSHQKVKFDDDEEKRDDYSYDCVHDDNIPPELITWQELLKISNDAGTT